MKSVYRFGRKVLVSGSAVGLAMASAATHAAVDTTAVVTEISGGTTAVEAVGGATLIVIATAALFRYVRRAL